MNFQERPPKGNRKERISYKFYSKSFRKAPVTAITEEASGKGTLAVQKHLHWLLENPRETKKYLKKPGFIFFIGDTNEDGTVGYLVKRKGEITSGTVPVFSELGPFDQVLFVR